MNETLDYGEPWRYCIEDHPFVVNRHDDLVIEKTDEAMGDMDIHRAISCVNACSGIQDPAAAISAARSSMADLLAIARIKWGNLDPDANKIMENALAAHNALTKN